MKKAISLRKPRSRRRTSSLCLKRLKCVGDGVQRATGETSRGRIYHRVDTASTLLP